MQQVLQIFEDENHNRVRSINIDGEAWFVAKDLCDAIGIANSRDALGRLDDDEKDAVGVTDAIGREQRQSIVSESGMYNLIFQSRKPEAKRFRKWVTAEVLPSIRKTGSYSTGAVGLPAFVRRFNDNWDRTDRGYFSVISELFVRLYGRFEQIGYTLPDRGSHGKEMRPDNSVGQLFSKWLKENHPDLVGLRKKYKHRIPEGFDIDAYQYPNDMLPLFIEYVDQVWLREKAQVYFSGKDSKALEYLPKLLPPPKK
ncbi:BRO-N domain-containing protein [Cerasicoccus fimbriatus]|uniref:BRO-N domain-containing protein n=1 Tax=Cerasicoccus fimbriatus TaxID=3014554 RepID=UPI0022B40841|nr:Bro-N domain-containing protein [Cerasicoccus sp. TK19100]